MHLYIFLVHMHFVLLMIHRTWKHGLHKWGYIEIWDGPPQVLWITIYIERCLSWTYGIYCALENHKSLSEKGALCGPWIHKRFYMHEELERREFYIKSENNSFYTLFKSLKENKFKNWALK